MDRKHAEKATQLQTLAISYCKGKTSQREDLRAQGVESKPKETTPLLEVGLGLNQGTFPFPGAVG